MHAIGIDIGGTKIAGAVVDDAGSIVDEDRVPTPALDSKAIEDCVVEMVSRLRKGRDIAGAGVAAAGFIDAAQSMVYYAPNLSWRNEPFRAKLAARLELPIVIENDANAAGWAEFRFGAAHLVSDMVMLTIGTGVGGAIVISDEMFRGGFGTAGELGHLCLVPGGLPCGCGARGCLEQYGSGRALARLADEMADAGGIGGALAAKRDEAGGVLRGDDIAELVDAGDGGALMALRRLGGYIGQGCASIGAVLDPQMFVIGGGVAQAGDKLLTPISEAFRDHVPARGYHPEPDFTIAQLGNDAGVVGAADLARISAEREK